MEKKSEFVYDSGGHKIKSTPVFPLCVRGTNTIENLKAWQQQNPCFEIKLWIDFSESPDHEIEISKSMLEEQHIVLCDIRATKHFQSAFLENYPEDGSTYSDQISEDVESLFDYVHECHMDWEVIDLLKIMILTHEVDCGAEITVFSDIDISHVTLHEKLQQASYGNVGLNLLLDTGFLFASELASNGKIIADNKFFIIQRKATCENDITGHAKLKMWFEASARLAISGQGNAFRCMEEVFSKIIHQTKASAVEYQFNKKVIVTSLPLVNIGEISTRKK